MPTVWVDADAVPRAVKEVLFRASARTGLPVVLVANRRMRVPDEGDVRSVQVEHGFDIADEWITERAGAGDLVVTSDIPLQVAVLEKGSQVLEFRGENVTLAAAKSKLRVKDLLESLRDAGEIGGGPPAWKPRDTKRFAGAFDRWLETLRKR